MQFFRTRKTARPSTQAKTTADPSASISSAEATHRPRNSSGKNKNRLSLLFKRPFVPEDTPPVLVPSPASDDPAARPSLDAASTCVASDESPETKPPSSACTPNSDPAMSSAIETVPDIPADSERSERRRPSQASIQIRPLPPLPGVESLSPVGLGLVNAPTASDPNAPSSAERHAAISRYSDRRPSLPVTTRPASRNSDARSNRPQSFCGVPPSVRRRTSIQLPATSALAEGGDAGPAVRHSLQRREGRSPIPIEIPPRTAGAQGNRVDRQAAIPTTEGAIGRQRIAQFRAGWSSMSAASGEAARVARPIEPRGRFAARSTSMIEFAATDKAKSLPHRRVSSGTFAFSGDPIDSRRSSTASSLKPLALESAASHPSLKQLMKTKPIPPPPRPARSSARYCLRPTRDFSTQTPTEWDEPTSSRSSMIGRPRNHRRGSSWGVPAQLAPGSLSPTNAVASTLPPVPLSPAPSRYGLPSPSIYSVASFDTTARAARASRGAGSLAFEDLSQIAEASSPPLPPRPVEVGSPGALVFDSPFLNYSMRLSPVTEAARTPLIGSQTAPVPPSRSITPPPSVLTDAATWTTTDDTAESLTPLTIIASVATASPPDKSDSSDPESPISPSSSEKSYATTSPATSTAASDCSAPDNLTKADAAFPFPMRAPLATVILPGLDSIAPSAETCARPGRNRSLSPVQLQTRRFSEADKLVPRLRNGAALDAEERAAKGRSFFLVQALMGDAPTDGVIRDWAKNLYPEDETSDEESLLGQPTSEESDLEED